MKRFLITAVAMMAVGQEPESVRLQEQPRADAEESISGVVTDPDSSTNRVTITTKDQKEISFTVDAETKVTKRNEPFSLSELKKGMEIKAEVQNSRAIAIPISIQQAETAFRAAGVALYPPQPTSASCRLPGTAPGALPPGKGRSK